MKLDKEIFSKCSINFNKLVPYGFQKLDDGTFLFYKAILDGEFKLEVIVDNKGSINSKIIEVAFDEEFYGLEVEDYIGGFIGEMKEECLKALQDIKDNCCEDRLFRFDQSNRIVKTILERYDERPDYPFEDGKDQEDAVFRYSKNQKWYGILMPIKRSCISKKAEDTDIIDVLNVKIDESKRDEILKLTSVYPAYHMNKLKWISIVLDGGLDDDSLMELIDTSRNLVMSSKKIKREPKTSTD